MAIIQIGEFEIINYGDGLLIVKDGEESMEVSLEILRRFWEENF
jgi:hypothetical protein